MMRKHGLLIVVSLALPVSGIGHADEGMWTFDNPPRRLIKEK
jgi:hypothetical protein